MFAIAFDMTVAELQARHPRGASRAYSDIAETLAPFGFERAQGSVYIGRTDDMARLFAAIAALTALPWFPACVRDLRGFRVENWSDFTGLVRPEPSPR